MALMDGGFLFAWCVAGTWLSWRTKKLPESPIGATLMVLLFGPAVWFLVIGWFFGRWVHRG